MKFQQESVSPCHQPQVISEKSALQCSNTLGWNLGTSVLLGKGFSDKLGGNPQLLLDKIRLGWLS